MHAFGWMEDFDRAAPATGERYRDVLLARARGYLEAAAAVARVALPELVVQQQLIVGYPAEVLMAEARRAQLVALGAIPD